MTTSLTTMELRAPSGTVCTATTVSNSRPASTDDEVGDGGDEDRRSDHPTRTASLDSVAVARRPFPATRPFRRCRQVRHRCPRWFSAATDWFQTATAATDLVPQPVNDSRSVRRRRCARQRCCIGAESRMTLGAVRSAAAERSSPVELPLRADRRRPNTTTTKIRQSSDDGA